MAETLILAGLNAGAYSVGTATALSSVASVGSLISGGLTAASAFGSVMGGYQQNNTYKAQTAQSELAAKTEELKGREQADKIRRSLQATLASQNAIFSARGISLSSGTPVNIGNVSRSEAAMDVENAQFGADINAAQLRAQGKEYKLQGRSAITTGYTGAATSIYAGRNSFGSLLPR
jgi:hypothetical protein